MNSEEDEFRRIEREALRRAAQQQAEPVAQRKPLTDEEIQKIWDGAIPGWSRHITFARAIEAKLKEQP